MQRMMYMDVTHSTSHIIRREDDVTATTHEKKGWPSVRIDPKIRRSDDGGEKKVVSEIKY
jgi:hypothetical protein